MLDPYRKTLVLLFGKVHELQAEPVAKRMLALEIQEELLRLMSRAEYLIRKKKAANKAIKCSLSRPGNDRLQAQTLKEAHAAGEDRINRQRALISTLRSIGDAIAFIYGDRWDLKKMIEGTRLERQTLRHVFDRGGTAVMNDLTHTLRHGDITVFLVGVWPPGECKFLLLEMKSGRGGNHERRDRQVAAIQTIFDYLDTDKRETDTGTWVRQALTSEPKHHFDTATRLAKNLQPGSCIREEVEPGLHYLLLGDGCNESSWASLFPPVQPKQAHLISCNEIRQSQFGYYPFPLCFQDADVLFRFYNGTFVMLVLIELNKVNDLIQHHNLQVRFSEKEDYPWAVFGLNEGTVKEDPLFYISFHPLGRLAAEFVRLDWFITNLVLNPVIQHADIRSLADASQ